MFHIPSGPTTRVRVTAAKVNDAVSRGLVLTQITVRGIATDCREEAGITELSVMLIVAGILTIAASTAAVAVQGGVNNVVNGITNRLAAA